MGCSLLYLEYRQVIVSMIVKPHKILLCEWWVGGMFIYLSWCSCGSIADVFHYSNPVHFMHKSYQLFYSPETWSNTCTIYIHVSQNAFQLHFEAFFTFMSKPFFFILINQSSIQIIFKHISYYIHLIYPQWFFFLDRE